MRLDGAVSLVVKPVPYALGVPCASSTDAGSIPAPHTKPDMQALRDICAGKIPSDAEIDAEMTRRSAYPVALATAIAEIPLCGKTWWEEGEQFECLMDAGHREALANKHGLRGMLRKLDA